MNRIFLSLLFICTSLLTYAQKESNQAVQVHVTGLINSELLLDQLTLHTFKIVEGKGFGLVNDKGEVKRTISSFKGILLADIIAKAGVKMTSHKEQGKYYIVVTATDNYQVVFGYDEIMYGAANTAAYLMLELDGKPLGTDRPYVIACPGDRANGPRYIRMVKQIEVRKI